MAKSGKYSFKERLNIEELYNTFLGLAPREQLMAAGGVFLVLLFIIVLPITCASSRLGKLEKQIDSHEKDVAKVVAKISEYKAEQASLSKIQAKIKPKSQVQLTTRLESLATQGGFGSNIDSLKEMPGTPGEDFEELVVSVRMSRLNLSQIIEFLYNIENQSDLSLNVKRLELKPRYDNRQQFDANFDVGTLVSSEGGG
jgi:type II secretion system (T2SS) protein M